MHYFFIALVATTIGAIVGVGGGVILRPVFGLLGMGKDLASFSSAVTVFFMAGVNTLTGKRNKINLDIKSTVFLAAASIIGAFIGAAVLKYISGAIINVLFVFVLLGVVCIALFRSRFRCDSGAGPRLQLAAGLITGFLSGLFGIGGGPFQMAALLLLFDFKPKEAALQSTFITFLTTAAALVGYTINGYFDFSVCLYTIPGGILGGFLGAFLTKHLKQKYIPILFAAVILAVLVNQIYLVIT